MAAHEHLNEELFHGSSDRFGILKKGQIIIPGNSVRGLINQHHQDSEYPEALDYAHATFSRERAEIYADWAANGYLNEVGKPVGHENIEKHGIAKPIVYSVKPAADQEDDPQDWQSVRSKQGFEVIGRRRMRKLKFLK